MQPTLSAGITVLSRIMELVMRKRAFVLVPLILSGSLMLASRAFAEDSPGTRFLSDPSYLPYAGQFEGRTAFAIGDGHGNTYDASGALLSHFYDQSDRLTQVLQYGITDDIAISLDENYLPFDKRTRTSAAGTVTSRSSSGFTDPALGITWRALDQDPARGGSPLNLDLFGTYSPDWVGARSATATSEGNEGRGGQAGTLGVALSEVWPAFTLYGSAAAVFLGSRHITNPGSGATNTRDSSNEWRVDLSSQYRASDDVSFNAGIAETFGRDKTVIVSGSGAERFNDPAATTDLHLAANYTFIPQDLVGSLTYGHSFSGTARAIFPTMPANDTTTRGRQENVLGLQLDYAFN